MRNEALLVLTQRVESTSEELRLLVAQSTKMMKRALVPGERRDATAEDAPESSSESGRALQEHLKRRLEEHQWRMVDLFKEW